jgi:hypothetical protein
MTEAFSRPTLTAEAKAATPERVEHPADLAHDVVAHVGKAGTRGFD